MPELNTSDEEALVARAQHGDADAFGCLVQAYQRFVYNLALRSVGNPAEAEDLAQEAFVRAWVGLPRFRGEAKFRTWLYRIVVNLCYSRLAHLRSELDNLQEVDAFEDLTVAEDELGQGDLAWQMESEERQRLLQQEMDRLPGGFRMMLLMRYQQELPYEEIAEAMGLPLGPVKTGLFRAKQQLRKALYRYEEAPV